MQRIGHTVRVTLGLAATILCCSLTAARAEPPIRSPEDAACRNEARAKVFTAPNPRALPIEEVGKTIYYACMKRIGHKGRAHRRHHHAH